MRPRTRHSRRTFRAVVLCAAVFCCAASSYAQTGGYERTFPQSKTTVEKVLRELQSSTAGRLPVLDGFATSSSPDHPLERYRRGYYQSKVQVTAAPSGGSIVHVTVEVTAWYSDPQTAKSGYQLLTSNGRLEQDLLDQLSDQLAANAPQPAPAPRPSPTVTAAAKQPKSPASTSPAAGEPTISAPVPRLPEVGTYSSSLSKGLSTEAESSSKPATKKPEDGGPLQNEVDSLEEILKNQGHPKNLVAVKKSGTPVVAKASLTAKTLFLASAHDEFEMLDFNRDWVHVRISGLSRGWIWRDNLEMPDSVPDSDKAPDPKTMPAAAELFHISREEVALFPGDWSPLRGRNVKIVSVENNDDNAKDTNPQLRLEFVKSVLDRNYAELAQKPQELAGIVVIFDAADGGMIAATFPTLQQWKACKLSDAALWHQCFFDPPETFPQSGASGTQ
ncbi:MAG: hypothetical protein WCB59_10095 [Candidatus Sulfotelmatobacter sp.]